MYLEAQAAGLAAGGAELAGTTPSASAPRVLEIGCGASCASVFDSRFVQGSDVIGVDVTMPEAATLEAAAAFALARGHRFRFEAADATDLRSFADASVDAVVCSLTLCSVLPSAEAAVAEVKRV